MTLPDRDLISPEELAEHLGIPVATVYQWRMRDYGPTGIKVGRHVRYFRADVEAWIDDLVDADAQRQLAKRAERNPMKYLRAHARLEAPGGEATLAETSVRVHDGDDPEDRLDQAVEAVLVAANVSLEEVAIIDADGEEAEAAHPDDATVWTWFAMGETP